MEIEVALGSQEAAPIAFLLGNLYSAHILPLPVLDVSVCHAPVGAHTMTGRGTVPPLLPVAPEGPTIGTQTALGEVRLIVVNYRPIGPVLEVGLVVGGLQVALVPIHKHHI